MNSKNISRRSFLKIFGAGTVATSAALVGCKSKGQKTAEDEYKQQEGDPQIKGQIRQRMREASRRRMMQNLPKADVVITNPTHYAVAIRYEPSEVDAPVVLAKGEGYLAQRIKDVARENNIYIMENSAIRKQQTPCRYGLDARHTCCFLRLSLGIPNGLSYWFLLSLCL